MNGAVGKAWKLEVAASAPKTERSQTFSLHLPWLGEALGWSGKLGFVGH
jgi:hypothetical protein